MYAANNGAIESAELSTIISCGILHRSNEKEVFLNGMCRGAATDQLFLADSESGVRALDVRAACLLERDVFLPPDGEKVNAVSYSKEFDALIVGTWHEDNSGISVRALFRTNADSEWTVGERFFLSHESHGHLYLRILSNGTIIFGQEGTDGVHVVRMLSDRTMKYWIRLQLPNKHKGIDAQLVGDEKRLAVAFLGEVALFRVEKERVALLSRIPLLYANDPLFCGDMLLVGVAKDHKNGRGVLFSIADGKLKRDRQLIPYDKRNWFVSWCFSDGTIYAWDNFWKTLLGYKCKYSQP